MIYFFIMKFIVLMQEDWLRWGANFDAYFTKSDIDALSSWVLTTSLHGYDRPVPIFCQMSSGGPLIVWGNMKLLYYISEFFSFTIHGFCICFMCSKFKEIYDESFFLSMLKNDVRVVDTIPGYLMERFDRNMSNVLNFRVKAWAPIQYYKDVVLPRLLEEK